MELKYGFNLAALVIVLEKDVYYEFPSNYKITLTGSGEMTFEDLADTQSKQKVSINAIDVFNLFKYAVEIGFFEMKKEYADEPIILANDKIEMERICYDPIGPENSSINILADKNRKKVTHWRNCNKRLLAFEKRILKVSASYRLFTPIKLRRDGTILAKLK